MDFCPNKDCSNHSGTPKDWYVKIGYYKPKNTNQKTPRYKCKSCGKSFLTHTNKSTAWQKFAINNTFAKMRHDMNRLARKTWSTTKAIHGLENHIWLYVAWINKYKVK